LKKITSICYNPKPLIATMNSEHTGVLEDIEVKIGQESLEEVGY
jgi:hypothetical protein